VSGDLVDQCVERIASIFHEIDVNLPLEAFPKLVEQMLEGSALLIDTENQQIHCYKNGSMFEDERVKPSKGHQSR
jgi:hypothetical protein